MIWHIFKKDLKLTWPLAAAVTALHWSTTAIMFDFLRGTSPPRISASLPSILILGGLLATGVLITMVVQLDPLPGVRQDWLVRPIWRKDLFAGKLLFVVLIIQLPIFASDVTVSLANGFSFPAAFTAASKRSLTQLLIVNIPFMALASITKNLLEALGYGVVVGLTVAVVNLLSSTTGSSLEPIVRTGLQWMIPVASFGILIVGAGLVVVFQYWRRPSRISRTLATGITGLLFLTSFLPWGPAFAFQKSLSNAPGSSRDVALSFDPGAGKYRPSAGGLTREDAIAFLNGDDGLIQVRLPLRVTGLPPDSALENDRAEVRLIDSNGHLDRFKIDRWQVRREGANPTETIYPTIPIPAAVYKRVKDQSVRLEMDSWLTLVQASSRQALPAFDGREYLAGVGLCSTTINDRETTVQLRCAQAGSPWHAAPVCFGFFLSYPAAGLENPHQFVCRTWIPFYPDDPLGPDPLWRNGANLNFRDPIGLAHYPVDGSKLRASQAVIQTYRAQDHFTRKLVIPDVHLSDWSAETPRG
jgi:hypothetical protein